MAAPDLDPRDRELLDEVAAMLQATDPVPPAVLAAGRAAFAWLNIDAELAALADDSALAGAGVRGSTTTARTLTFECPTGVVVVDVQGDGDERHLIGQTDRPADVEIRHRGPSVTVTTDEYGRFRVDELLAGPVSLRCVFHDTPAAPIVTSWVIV
ncbi:MAG: hypothetical protein ACXV4A_03145 [Actinomycetes bacterium]